MFVAALDWQSPRCCTGVAAQTAAKKFEMAETKDFNIVMVITVASLLNLISSFSVQAQSPPGFVSIDCGGEGGRDAATGLDWSRDDEYLESAAELRTERFWIPARATFGLNPVENADIVGTASVFWPVTSTVTPRSKFCYNLPVEFNASEDFARNYLLRVTFPSSNLTPLTGSETSFSTFSTRFYFTVDSTYVATVELEKSNPKIYELIVTPIADNLYVCLVPLEDRSSMPAISAVELRPFRLGMYARSFELIVYNGTVRGRQKSYLMTVSRLNFGGDVTLRYPDDDYDRLWAAPRISNNLEVRAVKSSRNVTTVFDVTSNDIDPPINVLNTAWEATSLNGSILRTFNLSVPGALQPTNFYYNILLADLFTTVNSKRFMDLFYDQGKGFEVGYPGLEIGRDYWSQISSEMANFLGDVVVMKLTANASSTLPALINCLELYAEFGAVRMRTNPDDAGAVRDFAVEYPLQLDQTGDPCLPTPWAWLVCSIELPPRVTQINLTSKGLGGPLPFMFGRLKRLTMLDLANNFFSGNVPGSLGNITALRALNLANNQLSGDLPQLRPNALPNLEFLSLASNQLSGNLSSLVNALDDTLTYLDVSENVITGAIPMELERLSYLQDLDLSGNHLSGTLNLNFTKFQRLRSLSLKNNHLQGTVPDSIWNSFTLEHVNVQGNKFTEVNLTTWYLNVAAAKSFDAPLIRMRVRLMGNQIRNVIVPSLKGLDDEIIVPSREEQRRLLSNPAGFILLADNPWCKDDAGRNWTLMARYLCRFSENEEFWSTSFDEDGISRRTVTIIGVICGLLFAVIVCGLVLMLFRLLRRTRELQKIQAAFAKEKVKPPFFDYHDLKTATRNFSKGAVLGKGGFGTVYKADFQDGSILAVKRLNPTEQNTSDFLKEMVNISGIKHRNLIQLKGCCVREKQQRMLVYEFAENKSLAEALWGADRSFVLSWEQRVNICLGIARGLAYLHEELQPKMVHRDIKPQNILLDVNLNAKIADFGLIRPTTADNTQITEHIGGTRGYCSPEYLNEGFVSEKLDVYSFGIVLLEIVSGRICVDNKQAGNRISLRNWALELYEGDELLELVDKELGGRYDEPQALLVLRTALACCQLDARKRPIMSQVVNTLTDNAEVAIDILAELRERRTDVESLEKMLEDDPTSPYTLRVPLSSGDNTPLTELTAR